MVQAVPDSLKERGIDYYLAQILSESEIPFFTDGTRQNELKTCVYGRLGEWVLTFNILQGWRASGGPVPVSVAQELLLVAPKGTVMVDGDEIQKNPEEWGEVDDQGNQRVYFFTFPVFNGRKEGLTAFREIMRKHGYDVNRRSYQT